MLTFENVAQFVADWHNHQVRVDSDDTIQFDRRMDARETAFLSRQLEYVKSRTYDVRYPNLKARQFIPVDTSAPSGARTITYRQWNMYAVAKIISNYADDLPRVDVIAQEYSVKPKSLGAAYGYSVQDLRSAAMANERIDVRKGQAARRAIESGIDQIGASGNAAAGLVGIANLPNVPLVSPDTGSWDATTSPLLIIADLNKLVQSIIVASKEVFAPDTILMDTGSFTLLNQMYMSADNNVTVLRAFLNNSPYIRNIDQWAKLDTANAAGNGPRLICYLRSPEVLTMEIPQDFEQFPPERRNLEFVINCHARTAGVVCYYPLAIAYMDGV